MTNRTDNFNRTDSSTDLGTPSDAGSAWVAAAGTWGITSNTGYKFAAGATFQTAYLEASVSNVDVEVTMPSLLNCGPVARLADSNNFLMVQARDTNNDAYLYKRVAGTFTQLGSTYSGAVADGDTIKLTVTSANAISVYLNGTLRIGPATDSAGSSNTKHGLMAYEAASDTFDTFSITEITSAAIAAKSRIIRQAVNRASTY